jgi:sugar phosphate isomerase/epimerase
MKIGIFSRTFARPTLAETLDAVIAHGLHAVQFGLECAGLEPLPEAIDATTLVEIRQEFEARKVAMSAISGTFNMIHPDEQLRQDGLRRLGVLAAASPALGTNIITLCTGTRNEESMWRRHPDNSTSAAWRDLLASMRVAAAHAEAHNVILGVEPEVSNVVDSAPKARRLLDELGSSHVKIVMDGANLYPAGSLPRMRAILDEAFELLGDDIVLAHAKDLDHDGDAGHLAAGTGLLDYDHYLALLRQAGYNGPLILHSLAEDQVDASVGFLRGKLR